MQSLQMHSRLYAVFLLSTSLATGCMEPSDRGLGPSCEAELQKAEADLKNAKANSIGKAFHWTQAGALIAAGRTQQQFSEYENCVIKARKAQSILRANE